MRGKLIFIKDFFFWTMRQGKFKAFRSFIILIFLISIRSLLFFLSESKVDKLIPNFWYMESLFNISKKIIRHGIRLVERIFGANINVILENVDKWCPYYFLNDKKNDFVELCEVRKSLLSNLEKINKELSSKVNFPKWAKIEADRALGIVDGFKREIKKADSEKTTLEVARGTILGSRITSEDGVNLGFDAVTKAAYNWNCNDEVFVDFGLGFEKKMSREQMIYNVFKEVSYISAEYDISAKYGFELLSATLDVAQEESNMTPETMDKVKQVLLNMFNDHVEHLNCLIKKCKEQEECLEIIKTEKIKEIPNADYQTWTEDEKEILDNIINNMYNTALNINERI